MRKNPAITFGIIVLNGEPFTLYNLRSIYPFAHEIIIAEGASPKAAHAATSDGHSIDGTLDILHRFKNEEDPENKVTIVTAEDEGYANGFWPGEKDEQSQAYAKRATGDWIWQIDIDEFYRPEDMQRVIDHLLKHPKITCMTFQLIHFWGSFHTVIDGGAYQTRRFAREPKGACRRIFQWGNGYQYITHRPPTIANAFGEKITDQWKVAVTDLLPLEPIKIYHYSSVFPFQLIQKGQYYENQGWQFSKGLLDQNRELIIEVNLSNAFQITKQYDTYNWLNLFQGAHPPQIFKLLSDIQAGRHQIILRRSDDIDCLLTDRRYIWLRRWFQLVEIIHVQWFWFQDTIIGAIQRKVNPFIKRNFPRFLFPLLPISQRRKFETLK